MVSSLLKFVHFADWPLIVVVLTLLAVGLIAVWSFSPPYSNLFARQIIWIAAALASFFVLSVVDYRVFRDHGVFLVVLYSIMIASLAALLLFAPATRGVRAWFRIGSAGIEPVEFTKLVLVLVLAKYFSRRHIEIARLRHLAISGLYAALAVVLVFIQPDLGAALILIAIWLAMVCFSGIKMRHLAAFLLISIAVAAFSWFYLLAPYQQTRITSFLDPYRDPRGSGYNAIQAMVAAGSGKLTGKGIGYGTQSHLNFLPEAETDFIFAAFAEEAGFIGSVILLGLFGFLFFRLVKVGFEARDNFSRLFVLGLGTEVQLNAIQILGLVKEIIIQSQ